MQKEDEFEEIPYGRKLIVKQRDLDEMEGDVEQKVQKYVERGIEPPKTVGFEDPERIRQILTEKRMELMKSIMDDSPESISALAEKLDRGISEVHHDLKILEQNKIVFFEKKGRSKKPVIPYEDIEVNYSLKQSLERMDP